MRRRAVAARAARPRRRRQDPQQPRTRCLDLTDVDKAVTYLTNSHVHMRYDMTIAVGWPIATGVIEGACGFEDRFAGLGLTASLRA